MRLLGAGSILLGPLAAWLYESGRLDLFASATLLNLWFVVTPAGVGIVVGVYAVVHRAYLVGILSLTVNVPVAALYGFLLIFFGLGGAR